MRKLKKDFADKSGLELVKICAEVGINAKAEEIVVLDVRGLTSFTDYFVIMSGRSTRHVQGIAEAIEGELRLKRVSSRNTEGYSEGLWILLDFNDVIVHIFYKESRKFYDLEGLWHDAKNLDLVDLMDKSHNQATLLQSGTGNKP